jgi:hypothetical protein
MVPGGHRVHPGRASPAQMGAHTLSLACVQYLVMAYPRGHSSVHQVQTVSLVPEQACDINWCAPQIVHPMHPSYLPAMIRKEKRWCGGHEGVSQAVPPTAGTLALPSSQDKQEECPFPGAYVPAEHSTHSSGAEKVPGGHSAQEVLPAAGANSPSSHRTQALPC